MASQVTNYKCPACTGPLHFVGASGQLEYDYYGAELICDATTAATSCPYCGNPTVVPGQFSGALKPEFVIPFKLSKEDAVAALKKHYQGKPFLPRALYQRKSHPGDQGRVRPLLDVRRPGGGQRRL